jgi:hypothetical protein
MIMYSQQNLSQVKKVKALYFWLNCDCKQWLQSAAVLHTESHKIFTPSC